MGSQLEARPGGRRRQLAERERDLATLARRQYSVVSRRQLIAAGLGVRTIRRRVEAGRLHLLHRGVYAFGDGSVDRRGRWLAAVLACGDGALLSHRSAAALWGLMRPRRGAVEVSAPAGRVRQGITIHEGAIFKQDRTVVDRIPVTSVARTLFDLAEVLDERQLERTFEEADRLRILVLGDLDAVCARGHGRRALRPIRQLTDLARLPDTQSPLEDMVLELCREHDLPTPVTGATILGREVDALWPAVKLMAEADSWQFHGHRAAFEDDRERDAAMQAEGYRVIRLTHRRLEREPAAVADQLRHLLRQGEGRASS
jgi:very-short-patch-repair endonuclease